MMIINQVTKLFGVIIFVLTLILPSTDLFGHASNDLRNRCNFFTKRYKSYTRTQGAGALDFFPCTDRDKDCDSSSAGCSSSDNNNVCASAEASASAGVNTLNTTFNNGCTAGLGLTDFSSSYFQHGTPIPMLADKYVSGSQLTYYQDLDSENKTYTIKNAHGKIGISKNYPGYVELRFTLWKAQDDYENQIEDESMTSDKIVLQEYIRIKNNRVEISEGLKGNKFISIVENEHFIQVVLNKFEHRFDIPEGVNIDKELVVNVASYSEIDDNRIIKEELNRSINDTRLNVSPNPSNGSFNIEYSGINTESLIQMELFDVNGKHIETLYKGMLNEDYRTNFQVHNRDLRSGIYLIVITGDGIFETRRLSIIRE